MLPVFALVYGIHDPYVRVIYPLYSEPVAALEAAGYVPCVSSRLP